MKHEQWKDRDAAVHSFTKNEERTYFMDKFRESDFYRFQSDDEVDYKVENGDSDRLSESETYEGENVGDVSVWSPAMSKQTIRDFILDYEPKLPRNLDVSQASPLKDAMYDRITLSLHTRK
ncbi:hypothetical protein NL108_008690 [Boleophthalmus pectinirostris]|nr:hypothetical protein NL108_008690 [Boleophthalmus pectinirostris]